METVLYADVLFLINFSMDYLSLYAVSRLLALPSRAWRMLAGAVLGGLYGVLSVVFFIQGLVGATITFFVSCGMVLITFGRCDSVRGLFRAVLSVWGIGALIGGFMTLFSGMFHGEAPHNTDADIPAAVLAVILFVRTAARRRGRGYAEISFSYGENTYSGRALIDSGNLLTDPISGLPVVLIRASDARTFAGNEVDGKFAGVLSGGIGLSPGVRAVPMRGVADTRILYGFLCDKLCIRQGKRTVCRSAVICVDRHSPRGYGECGVLLPAALL